MQGKVSPEPNAQTRVYVGIDTCKAWLDVYVHPIDLAFRVPNSREGLEQLKRRLAGLVVVLIVMEATGKLHREAQRNLNDSGYAVAVVDPLRSRLFAEAVGQLAKTDKVDARMLAMMGAMLEPKVKPPAPETVETFQELVRGRNAFVRERTALLNQLGDARATFLKQQIRRQIRTIEAAIERLGKEIVRIVKATSGLQAPVYCRAASRCTDPRPRSDRLARHLARRAMRRLAPRHTTEGSGPAAAASVADKPAWHGGTIYPSVR